MAAQCCTSEFSLSSGGVLLINALLLSNLWEYRNELYIVVKYSLDCISREFCSISSRNEYYLGVIIALLLQDHRNESPKYESSFNPFGIVGPETTDFGEMTHDNGRYAV